MELFNDESGVASEIASDSEFLLKVSVSVGNSSVRSVCWVPVMSSISTSLKLSEVMLSFVSEQTLFMSSSSVLRLLGVSLKGAVAKLDEDGNEFWDVFLNG